MTKQSVIYNQTGKRKTAVANAFLKKGTGIFVINKQKLEDFFSYLPEEIERFKQVFVLANIVGQYNAEIYVKGGGTSAQADAIRLAVAKSICKISASYRLALNKSSLLFRDSRIKERRKYGLKKARKAPQYSKR